MSMLRTSMVQGEYCDGSQKYCWYIAVYQHIQPDLTLFEEGGWVFLYMASGLTLARGSGSTLEGSLLARLQVGSGVLAAS
jgi:hypothetical protein